MYINIYIYIYFLKRNALDSAMRMELCVLFAFSATKAPRACEKHLKCVWWIVGWNLPLGGPCFFGR